MNKEIKKKLKKGGSTIYDKEWIEKVADERFDDFIRIFNESLQGSEKKLHLTRECDFRFGLLYYGAFEHAINMILHRVLDDTTTEIEFLMGELNKVTATIKKKKN